MRCIPIALSLVLAGACTDAGAQTWPTKAIRAIVPVGAGSTTDIVPRAVFEHLSTRLHQPIVVENRPGGGTMIGSGVVAAADPDGYTMLVNSSAHTIAPAMQPKLAFDPRRDLIGVVALGTSPCVLVVSPKSKFSSAADLVREAKLRPGKLNFSSVGIGTATHLSAERFRHSAGLDAVHVPYKGGAEAMTEVIAGRVDFFFGPLGLVLPHIKEGTLRPLLVNTSKRAAALPEVPTTGEAGFVDAEYPIWFGVFLPAKTPKHILERVNAETLSAMKDSKLRERLEVLGVESMPLSASEFDAFVQREFTINEKLVAAAGIKPE
jgi:tripartite-type tricarboxylate transporter receptor subunit TctC